MNILDDIDNIKAIFSNFQSYAYEVIGHYETASFKDSWHNHNNKDCLQGEGKSIVFENGKTIEKGGINFSYVKGAQLPSSANINRNELTKQPFQAFGVSIVFHPLNPYIPTSHGNIRLFISQNQEQQPVWWFGGGYDLTPFYVNPIEAQFWHQEAAKVCQPYGAKVYEKFKKNCDEYFWIKHRQETRGIGGLFFDNLNEEQGWSFEQGLEFVQQVGKTYINSYKQLIDNNQHRCFGKKERDFQLYRRGRYVEFNLIYDRGTLFGLQSGGRTESILMSLPNKVHWKYNYQVEENSAEADLLSYLKPIDWLNYKLHNTQR